ncbi:hypothetical protein BGW39_002192 [Mortierella sp. 14UC]|nr:hypothetical protein BGW39_002192 [Mortierella sp. 14UC]
MSANIVPHTSTLSTVSQRVEGEQSLTEPEQVDQQVDQQVVQAMVEPVSAALDPESQQPFLTSDPEDNIEPAPTAPLATELVLYLSLDLPTTVLPPLFTPTQLSPASTSKELAQVAGQRSCTPTEIAPASPREYTMPPPTPPRLRSQHQGQPMIAPGPSNTPRVTRLPAYTKSPGYIAPYKYYRDWTTGRTYTLLEPIAAGGFGCALKVKVKNQCLALKYDREVGILMSLKENNDRHPNIVAFGTAFKDREHMCLSLELANKSLESAIRAVNRLEAGLVKHLATGIASGLRYLHSNHILHRDIKPENILLTGASSQHALITDFGLAISLKNKPNGTRGECGTKQYRAPEMQGRNYYSYPVDVFAFGVTVHRMAGGRFPEQGGIFPLSSADVKEVVTELMHHLAGMRLRMDEAPEHPFFQDSAFNDAVERSKRLLDDAATEDDRKGKRARHESNKDNNIVDKEEHVQERISFSLLPVGCGLSLQDVQEATALDGRRIFSSI